MHDKIRIQSPNHKIFSANYLSTLLIQIKQKTTKVAAWSTASKFCPIKKWQIKGTNYYSVLQTR